MIDTYVLVKASMYLLYLGISLICFIVGGFTETPKRTSVHDCMFGAGIVGLILCFIVVFYPRLGG